MLKNNYSNFNVTLTWIISTLSLIFSGFFVKGCWIFMDLCWSFMWSRRCNNSVTLPLISTRGQSQLVSVLSHHSVSRVHNICHTLLIKTYNKCITQPCDVECSNLDTTPAIIILPNVRWVRMFSNFLAPGFLCALCMDLSLFFVSVCLLLLFFLFRLACLCLLSLGQ